MRVRRAVAAVAVLSLAGCGIVYSETERWIGVIEGCCDPPQVTLPDTVAVNERFVAELRTFGAPCVVASDTEVSVSASSARIVPYDVWNMDCISAGGRLIPHFAPLRFSSPGRATITFHGYGYTESSYELRDFVYEVWVEL